MTKALSPTPSSTLAMTSQRDPMKIGILCDPYALWVTNSTNAGNQTMWNGYFIHYLMYMQSLFNLNYEFVELGGNHTANIMGMYSMYQNMSMSSKYVTETDS